MMVVIPSNYPGTSRSQKADGLLVDGRFKNLSLPVFCGSTIPKPVQSEQPWVLER
jgi:hypothetical protein